MPDNIRDHRPQVHHADSRRSRGARSRGPGRHGQRRVFLPLSPQRIFEMENSVATASAEQAMAGWYAGCHLAQSDIDTYVRDGEFAPMRIRARHPLPCAIRPSDGRRDGDTFRMASSVQVVQVPMQAVRIKLQQLSRNAGFRDRNQYMRMTDEQTLSLFVSDVHGVKPKLRDFAHSARIEARTPSTSPASRPTTSSADGELTPAAARPRGISRGAEGLSSTG